MNKKILVIGCPGSGKSYLSKSLSNILNIPCFHIDNLYWNKDKTHITREELLEKYQDIIKLDSFILDGNYQSTLSYRFKYASTVIFLDFSLDDCIKGIKSRNNEVRDDIPWIQNEIDGEELIAWIKSFDERERGEIINLINDFKGEVYIIKNQEEVNTFLKKIKSV